VNSDTLRKTLIQIPIDPQEQAKIGEFFSSLDGAITLHQRKLETLKKLKRTLLQKMFPKKGQLKPELRFPGFTNDWEQRKLGELAATFGYGLNAAAKSFDGRHKYIRITDIDESTRRFLCSSLTSPDIDFEEAAPYRLAEGDVLFARTGASVGKSYRYVRTDGEVYFAGFLIRFRFKDKEAAEFVFQNSLTAKFQNFIKTSSQRSGQPGINAQQFSGYQIAVPNSEERERIGSFFSRLDTAITLHQRKLETYKKLKKSLLQKMFI
ncbi:restriction endonuclease subunit S, partial [Parasutterella excrementihominis]|uniref:restriction endonuclease subunit S n=1 Tax=Parasutterella excrementihominis TaxID=487175 RepID=UPI003A8DEA3F